MWFVSVVGRLTATNLQVRDLFGERCNTAVAGCVKCWNLWDGCSALECHCTVEETSWPFIRCHEELDYEPQLVKLLAWMPEQAEDLGENPHMDVFIVSSRFNNLCFVGPHKYWACYSDFEMQMRTNCSLTKMFVGWQNVEVFVLPPHDRPNVIQPVPDCWVGWEPCRLLLEPLLFVLAYYSGLLLRGLEADKVLQ